MALANNRLERGLHVPMGKVITLPLTMDGQTDRSFVLYVTHSVWPKNQPTDPELLKLARVIADAINQGTKTS